MSRRRWVTAIGAAVLAFGGLVVTAGPAQAAPACASAPVPELPGRGVVGFFESRPNPLPPQADPFAPNATTTIHDQYGYAGLRWSTYDLGCGPDLVRSPDAPMGTSVSNWLLTMPKSAVAATGAMVGAAFQPDFLGVFDPFVGAVMNTLRRTVFDQWALLVVSALGLLLIWRARRASLASSTGAVGWALLVMVIASVLFRWPLVAGHAADRTVTTTLGAVVGGLNGRPQGQGGGGAGAEATGLMHDSLLYHAWLGGEFGDANSAVAIKYGPAIFDAQALTWREADLLRSDPAAGQKLLQDKQTKFADTAAKIKVEDPDAYEYLTGRRSDARVGYSLLAGLATLCAVPFLVLASLLVIGALIIVRLGVMLFPAVATLGLFPTMRSLVTGVGDTVAAAVINSVVFGIGAAVTIKGYSLVLGPGSTLPGWLNILLVLLLSLSMWAALRPFRRLTLMVGAANPFADAAGGVGGIGSGAFRVGGRVLSTAAGTFLGRLPLRHRGAEVDPEPALQEAPFGRAEANTVLVTAPAALQTGPAGSVTIGSAGPVTVGATAAATAGTATTAAAGMPAAVAEGAPAVGTSAAGTSAAGVAAGTFAAGVVAAGAAATGAGSRPEAAPATLPPSPSGRDWRRMPGGTPAGPVAVPIGSNPFAGDGDRQPTAPRGRPATAPAQLGPVETGGARFESGAAGPPVPTGVGTWRPRAQPTDRLPDPVDLPADPPVIAAEEYEGAAADPVYRPGARAEQEGAYHRGGGRGQ
jgi:hypothetical protein